MRFQVLGPVQASGADGRAVPLGDRQRALLASLLARVGDVVSADQLADLLWGDEPPADPAAALHSQIARLRRTLPAARIITRPPGYVLQADAKEVDALRFDELVRAARDDRAGPRVLEEALGLWQGRAYAEFAETPIARFEAIRLEEARLHATEDWHQALLRAGRAAESLPGLEAFVAEHPLREQARATLMRALYALGRQADALASYVEYEQCLADELGLEPSASIQQLRLQILRQDLPEPPEPVTLAADAAAVPAEPAPAAGATVRAPDAAVPLSGLRVRYVPVAPGHRVAVASAGSGPPLVALPGWISSIDVIGSGRDPRSSLLQRLVGVATLTIYDRLGTGLSPGEVTDYGLEPSILELEAVVRHAGSPVNLLAMSQAGPVAVALAARRADLVEKLVFFGTYADGTAAFTRPELNATLVAMVRTHWGLGSKLFADLYRPDATDGAANHLASVLRESASPEVAARYLEAVYQADVTDLLRSVSAPAMVLHYRSDRVVPFEGGRQLALGLPDARLVALDGRFHLPDARDLDRIVATIAGFLSEPSVH
jgi:DNA-binding SARP family transcriptional activator/pimeloyl-ACP methyl ester carboxylesterase